VPTLACHVRGLWRLARATVHVLHGMLIVATRFGQIDATARMHHVQQWSAKFLRLLGVGLAVQGTPRPGGKLLVANHISWLDILAIDAVAPARFVSKSEVRHWPVFGWLATAAGTLYIERERPRDALRVVHQMAAALQAGETLAVFPEGTTADGHALLPFHANLLQGAIATATPVQPVALRFFDPEHAISPVVAYLDDTSLLQSLWSVVCAQGLGVRVLVLPAQSVAHADRRALAARLRQDIEARLVLARD
jgi:1-acyl-sn-glycerol-3-phosphate acyltransferase